MTPATPPAPGAAPSKKPPAKPAKSHRLHASFKEREYFTDNLAMLLKSAVPVGEALASIQASTRSRSMREALGRMQTDIDAGVSLGEALRRSGIVSGQTLALVRMGEASGHLVENMRLAAQQEEKRHIFQARVRSALIYPAFVLGLTLVVGLGVAWFLLPRLSDTFSQLQVELPLVSRIMIGFGAFLQKFGLVAVPLFFFACLSLGYVLFAAPKTKHIGNKILFALPGIGRLLREVEVAQFGYLLGTLLNAGLPVRQAIELLTTATSSPQYAALYQAMGRGLDNGLGFREALGTYKNSHNLIPSGVQQMIFAGERSGSLPDVLVTIGRTYEQKSDITTQNLESIIEPLLLVVVAIGVLLVAVAVILPIYSLVGGLG